MHSTLFHGLTYLNHHKQNFEWISSENHVLWFDRFCSKISFHFKVQSFISVEYSWLQLSKLKQKKNIEKNTQKKNIEYFFPIRIIIFDNWHSIGMNTVFFRMLKMQFVDSKSQYLVNSKSQCLVYSKNQCLVDSKSQYLVDSKNQYPETIFLLIRMSDKFYYMMFY